MTEAELQLAGRLHTLEFLLSQAFAELLRPQTDPEKEKVVVQLMATLSQTLSAAPPTLQTSALETANKILLKAVADSL